MIVAMLGDVMLGRGTGLEIEQRGPETFWGDTLPVLHQADLVIAGLECAITTYPVAWTRTPKVFHFRAPPRAVQVLQAAGIGLVSLANNHTLDFEVQGLLDTLDYLHQAGIAHAGAGRNLADARQPAVVEAAGGRVAMAAFTDNQPEWLAGPDCAGINYIAIRPDRDSLALLEQVVKQARAAGAEFLILSLHWGPNMRQRPTARFRQFAHAALDRGFDLVYGHSAHIFQGVEVYGNKLVLYDTGDFLDDYAVDPDLRNDLSLIFLVELDARQVRRLHMVPVRLGYTVVNLAHGADLETICERMQRLSAEMGTHVERAGRTLHVNVAQQRPMP